ncbi:hypothetical protein [Tolypothrix sp. NIES-4075]|uniref:hypothetical protein n=1 Tax=Tolypothrix sp. NIES-4075 TaxID=2005459 RepID=UPI00118099A5|nr:hypothetical protein [Tolypothrix sp. NIES-4075]
MASQVEQLPSFGVKTPCGSAASPEKDATLNTTVLAFINNQQSTSLNSATSLRRMRFQQT